MLQVLVFLLGRMQARSFDPREVWEGIEWAHHAAERAAADSPQPDVRKTESSA